MRSKTVSMSWTLYVSDVLGKFYDVLGKFHYKKYQIIHLPPLSSFESTLSLIEVVGGGVLLLLVEVGVGVWLRACPRLRRLVGRWVRFPSILDTDSTQTHNHHDPYISDQPYPFQHLCMWKINIFLKMIQSLKVCWNIWMSLKKWYVMMKGKFCNSY